MPVEERTKWLNRSITEPLEVYTWVRLKRASELRAIQREKGFDKKIVKYANNLALVLQLHPKTRAEAFICMVPLLLVDISHNTEQEPKRRRRLPRLLHPLALGDPKEAREIAHLLNPDVWWQPRRRYNLEMISEPDKIRTYQLASTTTKKRFKSSDNYALPFATAVVPIGALQIEGVVPRLSEIHLFAEGMVIGQQQLRFPAPPPYVMRWTYEYYLAAPVEIGHKVEAFTESFELRGNVVDICFENLIVRSENGVEVTVHAHEIRRFYEVGDTVKVVKCSNINREGWVISIRDDHVNVFDRQKKEEV